MSRFARPVKKNAMKIAAPRPLPAIFAFGLCLSLLSATGRAQLTVSNSATLTVTLAGSNVLLRADFATTNGAFTLVQGPRPDALQLPPHSFQISNQIVDIGWVPPARTAQWTLTNATAATRFFRLELEPVLTRGRALVFKDGWIDFEATRALYGPLTNGGPVVFKQPEEVWLDHLGTYDTNGVLIGSNEGMLTGFYGSTLINTIGELYPPLAHIPDVPRRYSPNNDFRIDYTGAANGMPRESLIWASEAQFYWNIQDYRTRFLNQQFVEELNLPPDLASNILHRQYRPDLMMETNFSGPIRYERPLFAVEEMPGPNFPFRFSPQENAYGVSLRDRVVGANVTNTPLSLMFDAGSTIADYAGLAAFWILGTNRGFPSDALWGGTGWQNNILPPINDGISGWVAYRYTGQPEVYREYMLARRRWASKPCGGTNVPCDKGTSVRNVMMHDESILNGDGVEWRLDKGQDFRGLFFR